MISLHNPGHYLVIVSVRYEVFTCYHIQMIR
jgi:hypothetical protein